MKMQLCTIIEYQKSKEKGDSMGTQYTKKLILEDKTEYYGFGFGADKDSVFELVFNTCMAGYQEILSDPSYTDQGVVMTYPLIGNYGMADDDYETQVPTIGALMVREYHDTPSNFRATQTLSAVMQKFQIPGISGIDTRKLTRSIRDFGSRKALLTNADTPLEEGLQRLQAFSMPTDAVSRVSCKQPWYIQAKNAHCHIVAIDCGIKHHILESFQKRGCDVTVVPWNTSAQEIERLCPDGVFLSNGPGNPEDVQPVIDTICALRGKYPMFGICLGHQLLALAYGARTYKMKFGHHGGNHPVRNLLTGKVEITSQNHSYAVAPESLKGTGLEATHINLLDESVEGMVCNKDKIFSVQYHPESAPGPQDSGYLFDQFVTMLKEEKSHAKKN